MAYNRTTIWITLSADLFLWGMINTLFGPSTLRIMNEFKIDFTMAGIAVSAMSFGGMFSIITGRFADRYGSYYVTRLSLFFMGLLTAFTGLSNNIILFIFLSFLTGISIGTFQASSSQVILDLYPEAKIKMLALTQVFFGVGATIGPTVTAIIISSFGDWKVGYILYGSVLTAIMIFQFFLKSTKKDRIISSYGKEESSRFFLVLLVVMLLLFILGAGVNSWLPTYIVSTNKASYLEASIILSCFWGGGTIMRVFVGKVLDKLGEKQMIIMFTFTGFISGILSLYATGFLLNALIWSIAGLVFAPIYPLIIVITYGKYRRSPGKVIGRLTAIGNAGALISAPLIGTLSSISNPTIATLVIPLSSLAIALIFLKVTID